MNIRKLTRSPLLLAASVGLLVCAFAVDAATACPSCKEALASDGGDKIAGYFWSILFMMSMPFTLLGGFSTYMYVLVRRARAAAGNAGRHDAYAGSNSTEELIDV
jgi:hypothetical protein